MAAPRNLNNNHHCLEIQIRQEEHLGFNLQVEWSNNQHKPHYLVVDKVVKDKEACLEVLHHQV